MNGIGRCRVKIACSARFEEAEEQSLLLTQMGRTVGRMELDPNTALGGALAVKQLEDDFARHLCLPRLKGREVKCGSITEAVVQHIESAVGAKVRFTVYIETEIPDGAPDNVAHRHQNNAEVHLSRV